MHGQLSNKFAISSVVLLIVMSYGIIGAFRCFERKCCLWHQGQNDDSKYLVGYICGLDGRCMECGKEKEKD